MKKTVGLGLMMVCLAGAVMAGTVTWDNGTYYVYTKDSTGGSPDYAPAAANWAVALYQDGGNGVMDDIGAAGYDDQYLLSMQSGGAGSWSFDGYFSAGFTSDGGITVYSRIYNASDFMGDTVGMNDTYGSASHYVNMGMSTLPSLGTTDTHYYNAVGTAIDGSDWKLIPEPSTFALFGLGILTLVGWRRSRK